MISSYQPGRRRTRVYLTLAARVVACVSGRVRDDTLPYPGGRGTELGRACEV